MFLCSRNCARAIIKICSKDRKKSGKVKMNDSITDNSCNNLRPQFGNRRLKDDSDVFEQNAWDHVEWDQDMEYDAQEAIKKNSTVKMNTQDCEDFKTNASAFWNSFYDKHENRFFKDRHWLFTEFPDLNVANSSGNDTDTRIFEIGCGVGNTLFPILKYCKNPKLQLYGCDFSEKAIELLQKHKDFQSNRCRLFHLDASLEEWPQIPFPEASLDIVILVFVLSAIEPSKMKNVAKNCFKYLRPGGILLFRDYGRYDLTQLRFKEGKCLEDNFYVRGDGTLVYFFTQEELSTLFGEAGFIEQQNIVDRRLQVNRSRRLKMYRVWIQMKLQKPPAQECSVP